MNVGIGTVAAQFLSWEYLFRNYGIVYLQCMAILNQRICLWVNLRLCQSDEGDITSYSILIPFFSD
jgi:hypothetical protein